MRVPQQGVAELLLQAGKLLAEPRVIRLPIMLDALLHFRFVRFAAGEIERLAVEGIDRYDPRGVLARIEIGVVRRAVEVDDIARVRGDEHAGAELVEKVVKPFEMPVGVRQRAGRRRKAGKERLGDDGPRMRHRHEERRAARSKAARLHQCDGSRFATKR